MSGPRQQCGHQAWCDNSINYQLSTQGYLSRADIWPISSLQVHTLHTWRLPATESDASFRISGAVGDESAPFTRHESFQLPWRQLPRKPFAKCHGHVFLCSHLIAAGLFFFFFLIQSLSFLSLHPQRAADTSLCYLLIKYRIYQ